MNRIRFVKQYDARQCGAACLAMICAFYGRKKSIYDLENVCRPGKDGVSLRRLTNAASTLGFDNACAYLTLDDISQSTQPIILLWDNKHYVVFYRKKGNKFVVADPAVGIVRFTQAEFLKHWISRPEQDKGICVVLEPNDSFYNNKSENSGQQRSITFLLSYVKKYKKYFFSIAATLLLCSVFQLVIPFLTQAVVDVGIRHQDIGFIWLILVGELMLVVGGMSADFIRRWLSLHISMRINITLVSDFLIKMLKLPMSFFDTKLLGDLQQRMGDHSRIQAFLSEQILSLTFSAVNFIIFGVVLLIFNRVIFAVFALLSIAYTLWTLLFLRKREMLDYEIFGQSSKSGTLTYQLLSNIQEIKLLNCEDRRRFEWEDVKADGFYIQMKSLKLQQMQEAGSTLLRELKNILITVISAYAVIEGDLTLGGMMAVQYVVGQLNSPLEQMLFFVYSVQDVKISIDRINDIHQREDEDAGRDKPECFKYCDNCCRDIELRDVSFRYDTQDADFVLKNVDLTIPAGKMTAIVGSSGSGKTTILKLILGYYCLEYGDISVAGKSLSRYNLRWWRSRIGAVMQNSVVFAESIAQNIAGSDEVIDMDKVRQVARIACIESYIEELPMKYNTLLGKDGLILSEGQKQRILIARALYRNPDFLIFDEATNSLDATNEKNIVEHLADVFKNKTVLVVAHRLSTVKNADQIVVVQEGKIVEIGTHSELIEAQGEYYKLIKDQLELNQDER